MHCGLLVTRVPPPVPPLVGSAVHRLEQGNRQTYLPGRLAAALHTQAMYALNCGFCEDGHLVLLIASADQPASADVSASASGQAYLRRPQECTPEVGLEPFFRA